MSDDEKKQREGSRDIEKDEHEAVVFGKEVPRVEIIIEKMQERGKKNQCGYIQHNHDVGKDADKKVRLFFPMICMIIPAFPFVMTL